MNFRLTQRITLVSVTLVMSSAACAPPTTDAMTNPPKASVQLNNIDFRAGHPLLGESLADATSYSNAILIKVLDVDSNALTRSPAVGAEVIGYTDNRECSGKECYELSFRRAKCVYEWLIQHGVPASKLRGPSAAGSTFPLDESETEEARQFNRRVQLDLFLIE